MSRFGVHQTLVYVVVGSGCGSLCTRRACIPRWPAWRWASLHPSHANPTELVDVEELADVSSVEHAVASRRLARSTVSTVEWLEHVLHPWTSYLIVPLFALANAGVVVSADSLSAAWGSAIFWGIVVGLVVGKRSVCCSRRASWCAPAPPTVPEGTTTRQLVGAGNAAGIGFTVALFIAELAFVDDTGVVDESQLADAKMAILLASFVSGGDRLRRAPSAFAAGDEALVDVQQRLLLFGRQQRIAGDGLAHPRALASGSRMPARSYSVSALMCSALAICWRISADGLRSPARSARGTGCSRRPIRPGAGR